MDEEKLKAISKILKVADKREQASRQLLISRRGIVRTLSISAIATALGSTVYDAAANGCRAPADTTGCNTIAANTCTTNQGGCKTSNLCSAENDYKSTQNTCTTKNECGALNECGKGNQNECSPNTCTTNACVTNSCNTSNTCNVPNNCGLSDNACPTPNSAV